MTLENNWLTNYTGDPFADTGGMVIKLLWTKPQHKDKSILELIGYITKIYVNNWGAKLHSLFLNSKITQAAFASDKKIEEAIKYYTALINDTLSYKEGYCRISGQKTKLYPAGRDNHILSGSSTYVNFHSNFEQGLYFSKEMLIRMYFLPLGIAQLSDKIALLASNDPEIMESFVKENLDENLQGIARGDAQGILKSPYSLPANAIFAFIDHYIRRLQSLTDYQREELMKDTNATLTLYHFTNFGAGPDANIHSLDSRVFQFYAYCNRPDFRKGWNQFLRSNYRSYKLKGATFDIDNETYISKEEQLDFDTYKIWKNEVLNNLLNGESILPNIVRWVKDHPFPSDITDTYLNYIRNMDKKTIAIVRKVADFMSSGSEDEIAKDIRRLRGHRSAYELRTFTIGLLDKNYRNNAPDPLFTLEEYADYLFPDGGFWRETKNLLLISIYENLHKTGKKVETPDETESKEVITETENNN